MLKNILPKEAQEEMPGATEKISKYKGSFLIWVVTGLTSVVVAESVYIVKLWSGNQREIRAERAEAIVEQKSVYEPQIQALREALKAKTREFDELKYILIPELNRLKPALEETKKKTEELNE